MRRWFLLCAILLAGLTACNTSNTDSPQVTELVVVTNDPNSEIQALEGTITAQNTQLAMQSAASPTVTPTPPRSVIGQGVSLQEAIILADSDIQASELGIIPPDTELTVYGQTAPNRIGIQFYQVNYNGIVGWVASTQLDFEIDPDLDDDAGLSATPIASASPNADSSDTVVSSPTTFPTPTFPPSLTPTVTPTVLPSGFPTPEVYSVVVVEQLFERGRMIWFQPINEIWVLTGNEVDPNEGTWECYIDDFVDGQPERIPDLDPPNDVVITSSLPDAAPSQPIRGFGKVWRENPDVREGLGWALTPETMHTTRYQYNAGGEIDGGEYDPAPGEYRIESLFQYTLVFAEDTYRSPCPNKTGVWEIQ